MTKPNIKQEPNVAAQVKSGVDLSDLELPKIPDNHVVSFDDVSPMTIIQVEELSDFAFRWLNPRARERGSMEGWQFVQGDLAKAVRRLGVVPALVGGDTGGDDLIRNGDLILGWMPRSWVNAYKAQARKKNERVREAMETQKVAEDAMRQGSGKKYLSKIGSVDIRRGNVQ